MLHFKMLSYYDIAIRNELTWRHEDRRWTVAILVHTKDCS